MKKTILLGLCLGALLPLVSCDSVQTKRPIPDWKQTGISTQPWNRPNATTDNGTLGSAIGTR